MQIREEDINAVQANESESKETEKKMKKSKKKSNSIDPSKEMPILGKKQNELPGEKVNRIPQFLINHSPKKMSWMKKMSLVTSMMIMRICKNI